MRQQAILKTKTDHVDELISYVKEVKPYHTKIIDTAITYKFTENVNIQIEENHTTTIDFFFDESNRNRHGFGVSGFGMFGLDQYPGQEIPTERFKPSKYGYDVKGYDTTRYGLTTTCQNDIWYSADYGLDVFPLDHNALDTRYNYSGLDEAPLDLVALDTDVYLNIGLDEAPLDINPLDYINMGTDSMCDPFIDPHFLVEDEFDHFEESSPTTIKATITEHIIIDTTRQVPSGFDYVGFDTYDYDTVPNFKVAYTLVGYDAVGNPEKYESHPYESTIRLVPTAPSTKDSTVQTVNDSEKE